MERTTAVCTTLVAIAAGALGAAGCASIDTGERASNRFSPANDCMFAMALRDWRPLDDENLILFGGGRTPYHVQLARPAFGLDFNFAIGVYDRDGRICPYGGDAIIVDGGGVADRITIASMKRLTDEELDALYVQYGIEAPPVVDEFEELPPDGSE